MLPDDSRPASGGTAWCTFQQRRMEVRDASGHGSEPRKLPPSQGPSPPHRGEMAKTMNSGVGIARASAADDVEPAAVTAAMAAAVARLRRMAATVFKGDAALFSGSVRPRSNDHPGRRVEHTDTTRGCDPRVTGMRGGAL